MARAKRSHHLGGERQMSDVGRPFPDEYVVLDGAEVLIHTPRQSEALDAFRKALHERPGASATLRFLLPRATAPIPVHVPPPLASKVVA